MIRENPVGERYLCARPFKQRAGDEHAEPKAAARALDFVRIAPRDR